MIYHPDRNSNSTESIHEMQRINHYYDILQKEFCHQDCNNNNTQGNKDHDEEDVPQSPQSSSSTASSEDRQRQQQCQQQQQQRQQQRDEEYYERRRQEIYNEMKKEWETNVQRMKEFKEQQKYLRRQNRRQSMTENLDTIFGRDQAHATYMSAVQSYQESIHSNQHQQQKMSSSSSNLNDIDDSSSQDLPSPRPSSSSSSSISSQQSPLPKPKNPLMEYCNEEMVVAMKLHKTDIAMEILRNDLETTTKRWAYYKMMQSSSTTTTSTLSSSSSPISTTGMPIQILDDKYYKHLLKVFLRPLDEERNTLLHYAVYMEDNEMVSHIVLLSRQVNLFPDVMLCENIRGLTANDYSLGCSVGCTIPHTMSVLTKKAKDMMNERTLHDKTLSQQQKFNFNFQPLIWTIVSVLIGRFIMNCNWIVSLIISGTSRTMTRSVLDDDDDGSDTDLTIIFYSYHVTWKLLHHIFVYGRQFVNYLGVPWQIQVLLMVFIPLNMKLKHFDFISITIPLKIFHHPLTSLLVGTILPRKQKKVAKADLWSFIILTILFTLMKSLLYHTKHN